MSALGYAAKCLLESATPVFDGANEKDIEELFAKADLPLNGKSITL